MKIVHVVQWLALGGGESVAVELALEQRARGHQVRVLCLQPETGPLEDRLRDAGVPVHRVPRLRAGLDPTLWPATWARLARWRPTVVHTHDPKSLVFAAPAARLAGARVVHTKHGLDVDTARRRALVRAASRGLHACVAVSDETAEAARQGECAPRKVTVIANGIVVDRARLSREAARAALGLPQAAWVIGAVGRLEAVKGHDVLLAAAPSGAHVCVIGDGSQRGALAAQAQTQSATQTHFVGLRADAAQYLLAFDVFAQPSRSEGLPLAVLEAMAASRPVVASAVGEMPKVLAGVGLIVIPGDALGLRAALEQLRADPVAATRLGAAGRARVAAHYSLAATAAAYDALYRDARD